MQWVLGNSGPTTSTVITGSPARPEDSWDPSSGPGLPNTTAHGCLGQSSGHFQNEGSSWTHAG